MRKSFLVDEPLSALDPTLALQTIHVLQAEATARNATLICSLHQVEIARACFTRIVALRDGKIVFDAASADVSDAMIEQLYRNKADPAPQFEVRGGEPGRGEAPLLKNANAAMPRDPAWRGRLIGAAVVLLVLWPMLVQAEFKPWILWDAQSLAATWQFLASFVPPAHSLEFLQLVAISSWETIAMATAGMALAMLGAIPLTLLVTERLSISRIGSGTSRRWPPPCATQSARCWCCCAACRNWSGPCYWCASSAWDRRRA